MVFVPRRGSKQVAGVGRMKPSVHIYGKDGVRIAHLSLHLKCFLMFHKWFSLIDALQLSSSFLPTLYIVNACHFIIEGTCMRYEVILESNNVIHI
jgi:hypothetical protein